MSKSVILTAATRIDEFVSRYRKVFAVLLTLMILGEAVRVSVRGKGGDFKPIVAAAERLGNGDTLYVENPTGPAFVYSPLFALITSPLRFVPRPVARFLWYLLSCASIIVICRLSARILFRTEDAGRAAPKGFWALAIVPVSYFAYYNALNGQVTPLMILLVTLSYFFSLKKSPFMSAAPLAASILIKPFPVIFLGFYFLTGQFSIVIATVAFLIIGLGIPALYFGAEYPSVLQGWLRVTRQQQSLYDISDWAHQSVSAFWYRFFGRSHPPPFLTDLSDSAAWAIYLSILAVVVLTVLATVRAFRSRSPLLLHATFGLYMVCWALLPPTSWKHYYLVLLFPCAVLAKFAIEPDRRGEIARVTLCFIFVGQLLLQIKLPGIEHMFYQMSLCLLMGLAVFGTLLAVVVKQRTQRTQTT